MSDESIIPEDDFSGDDMLAAELSLGVLTGDELVQTQRRARIDQSFAALVEDWDVRFSAFQDEIAPVEPPKNLFKKIAADAYPESAKRIWHKLGIIPALLGTAGAALVLMLALQYGGLMQAIPMQPTFVAQIEAEDQSLIVAAAYVDDGGRLFVERQAGQTVAGRSLELWIIAGDDAPVSLGVLAVDDTIDEIIIPENLRDRVADAVLAITDEPLGGSPTGGPTGAIVAAGEITTL